MDRLGLVQRTTDTWCASNKTQSVRVHTKPKSFINQVLWRGTVLRVWKEGVRQ
jgi:hypothetical protein